MSRPQRTWHDIPQERQVAFQHLYSTGIQDLVKEGYLAWKVPIGIEEYQVFLSPRTKQMAELILNVNFSRKKTKNR